MPVTVKTRLGWDDDSFVILDVARMLEQTGVAALTVHCRTRSQGYKGTAVLALFLSTFKDYPPSQKPDSWSIDKLTERYLGVETSM